MTTTTTQSPINSVGLLMWLKRRDAVSCLTSRSATDAEYICAIHKTKVYRSLGLTWQQFCKQRLAMDYTRAKRMIELYEEFGPAYFKLAELTNIRPSAYRRIRGAVSGDNLCHDGEEIAINAGNAPRLVAAVSELLRAAPVETNPNLEIEKAERSLRLGLAGVERLKTRPLAAADHARLLQLIAGSADKLNRLSGAATRQDA